MAKKLYYKIGEACKILDVKPFVLRYWETEFPFLNPNKSRSGQRIYSERDLEIIRRINELLNVEGYTIAGARKKLQGELESGNALPRSERKASSSKSKAAAAGKAALDTEAREKVERLKAGVEEALDQARGILELLAPEKTSKEAKKRRGSAA